MRNGVIYRFKFIYVSTCIFNRCFKYDKNYPTATTNNKPIWFNRIRTNSIINSEENDIDQLRKSNLENLELIKSSLIDFLARYDINEKVDFSSDLSDVNEIRMKEIKYLILTIILTIFNSQQHLKLSGLIN